ncbi:lasso peptide biosynthesis B2 protein [Sphingopyxis sp. LC81]|uniref:lasso peptide biosynthesis B2 protein n=1 Tax=Sphingopyxis sp. LC81 TaxID=1502850 RepID=UPI001377B094
MASYRLRPNLRCCAIGTRTICLDLSTSRYFLLENVAAAAFEAFTKGTASDEQTGWLLERNLVEAGVPTVAPSLPPNPTESIFDGPTGPSHPLLLLEAVASQWRARRNLEARPLGTLLIPTGLPDTGLDPCRPVAVAFARASRYRDATDQCLVRGLAMRTMLARRGLGVDLVIGVMLPFAAHCWVQAGPVVISDPLDRVQNFKPLLTVR